MRVRRESPAAGDRVVIEHAQRPESHVVRVVIAVETEQPVRRQPVTFDMKSVLRSDALHISSSYIFDLSILFFRAPYGAIDRKRSSSSDQQRDCDTNHQQMIFKTFSSLIPHPVHEESIPLVNREDRPEHHADQSQRAQPRQKAEDQPERTEKL